MSATSITALFSVNIISTDGLFKWHYNLFKYLLISVSVLVYKHFTSPFFDDFLFEMNTVLQKVKILYTVCDSKCFLVQWSVERVTLIRKNN